MAFERPSAEALQNESDVEQKFLYPFLVGEAPFGLDFDHVCVQTKKNIRRFTIDKGEKKKSYIPDYVITLNGVPLIVCEGKGPGADLQKALREARLYANELNAIYETNINPVKLVLATDGFNILAGYTDQDRAKYDIKDDCLNLYSEEMSKFISEFQREGVTKIYQEISSSIRPRRFWKPSKLIGGQAIRKEEITANSFGTTITTDFSHIFNPITLEDRAIIAKRAYVPSKRRERYIEPIDRIIRAAVPVSEARSKTVEDTSSPREIFRSMRRVRKLEHEILLIIGSAGSGKTTFVDYIQEVGLPRDLRDKTFWIRINMNPAPISRDEIYRWLREEVIAECKQVRSDVDFEELNVIQEVYHEQLKGFRKGVGRLYENDVQKFNDKLAEELQRILNDVHLTTINFLKYCAGKENKLPIIVLDNCDKRLRDEQLLMFEAAQWLQREFACLVVLPLREETYDNHYNEPPLDTALKDLVFRIEPPLFQKVLQERITLALSTIERRGKRILSYNLKNGARVEYPASDQAFYLGSILRSLFEHDRFVRRFIVGLSGRNIRRALEIFLQFCQSGHISDEDIFKIRQSEGQYVLPLEKVTNVLLRLNQRYYSSKGAYLKNLYAIDEHDEQPNYFSRVLILRYLRNNKEQVGSNRLRGYMRLKELREAMENFGVSRQTFFREIELLTKAYCIYFEDFRTENLSDNDLLSLAPAGFVHTQIIENVHYMATIAEDTWYSNERIAQGIADRIADPNDQYSPSTIFYNAVDAFNEVAIFRDKLLLRQQATFEKSNFADLTSLANIHSNLVRYEREIAVGSWIGVRERHPIGSHRKGSVVAIKPYGLLIDIEPGLTGLVSSSTLPPKFKSDYRYRVGSYLQVIIKRLDPKEQKISLILS